MLVPKLRFKREDGTDYPEWRYARTDEIAEINPKTSDLPNRFYYMDLGSVSKGAWQEKTITDKDNAPSRANRLASVGDVFFQSVRPYNMGHFFFEEEYEYPVVASTGFIQLRATQEYYNGFIYQLLYEDRFNAEVNIRCTGSNYPAINSESFSDIEMLFPCLEEQQKIADFLSAVDEVIAQSEAEAQNLEQQKKAAMQKIFSQEVRFKRQDGTDYPEWEEKKLSDLLLISKERNSKTDYTQNDVLACSLGTELDKKYLYFGLKATKESVKNYRIVRIGDIVYTKSPIKGFPNGIIRANKKTEGIVPSLYCVYHNESGIMSDIIQAYFDTGNNVNNYLYKLVNVGARNNVNITDIGLLEGTIIVPVDLEEQQKIAVFLSAYDEAISYAKQELDKWKELKKGLLQQMFV